MPEFPEEPRAPADPGARPMRRRGLRRVHLLLDATEALLAECDGDEVSLARIAERAGVPLASVYHFFPNRHAAFTALARRFFDAFYRMGIEPMEPEPATWQQVIATKQRNAAMLQNRRPAALRLFLGAGVSAEVRNADFAGNAAIAASRVKYFEAYFHMPVIPHLETRMAMSTAIQDGVWALSYGRHGTITEEFIEGGIEASVSYLRNYLPTHLPRKPVTADALKAVDVRAGHAFEPEAD